MLEMIQNCEITAPLQSHVKILWSRDTNATVARNQIFERFNIRAKSVYIIADEPQPVI